MGSKLLKEKPLPPTPNSPSFAQSSALPLRRKYGPSSLQWEKHKEYIKKYYITDDLPLKDIVNVMRANFGFDAEPGMYKAKFRKWGFQKYNREAIMQAIVRKLVQRDSQGKQTVIRLHGKQIERDEVMRYLNRKGIKNLNDAIGPGGLTRMEVPTPTYLSLVTPRRPEYSAGSFTTRRYTAHGQNTDEELSRVVLSTDHSILTTSDSILGIDNSMLDIDELILPPGLDHFLNNESCSNMETLDLDLPPDFLPRLDALEEISSPRASVVQTQLLSFKEQGLTSCYDPLRADSAVSLDNLVASTWGVTDKNESSNQQFDAPSSGRIPHFLESCKVFGNGPLHQLLLNTVYPVSAQGSVTFTRSMRFLVSSGADPYQQNFAAITPADLAQHLGFEYQFTTAVGGGTSHSTSCSSLVAPSPRIKRWLEDYYHYTALGCSPASCRSDYCLWWDEKFRLNYLSQRNRSLVCRSAEYSNFSLTNFI